MFRVHYTLPGGSPCPLGEYYTRHEAETAAREFTRKRPQAFTVIHDETALDPHIPASFYD